MPDTDLPYEQSEYDDTPAAEEFLEDPIDDADTEDAADVPQHAEDISFLDNLLESATAATNEERRLKQARKRLVKLQKTRERDTSGEKTELIAEIRALEEKRVWQTVGCVALFYHQVCLNCQSHHNYFAGWFIVRTHATDSHLRELVRGELSGPMPRWIETDHRDPTPICANCVELHISERIASGQYTSPTEEA